MTRAFIVRITMCDGSRGRLTGLYTDGCSAVISVLDHFPDAKSVSAIRVTP